MTEARELLSTQGAELFRQRCGDEFVVVLITGGEYLALVEVQGYFILKSFRDD